MKEYSNKIALIKNGRGIYCIDTSIGCYSGTLNNPNGCYNDCYALRASKRYGYDFTKTVLREFESERHKRQILIEISKIKLDFIRIGCSGDPSENWEHCIKILNTLKKCNKEIVIITKHWNLLTDSQLMQLSEMNVCINTSVSALDNADVLHKNLCQYNRLKPFCKSILRVVSCDFNKKNPQGLLLSKIQDKLFIYENVIDTIFRPSKNNLLVTDEIINVSKGVFNNNKALVSKFNRKTYSGKCDSCKEMCGISLNKDFSYKNKRQIVKQLNINL